MTAASDNAQETTWPGLLADIGGTHARFALGEADGSVSDPLVLACRDFPGPAAAAEAYLATVADKGAPRKGAFAVASPVIGDTIDMTNHTWTFRIDDVRRDLNLDDLRVINDFAAIALAVPHLGEADRHQVGGGTAVPDAPIAVLGPGTGLGVSALVPAGGGWVPLATEGGHVTMAATTEREDAVIALLRRDGHVSAEDVISGVGLVNLYRALSELEKEKPAPDVTPAEVTERALEGTCPRGSEALEMFCVLLGTAAANLALSLGARGGVYVAGGIVPKLGDAFAASGFRRRFEDKGRFSDYLAAVPTYVVTHELPAFVGLSHML
jgi:glucokinase